MKQEKLKLYNKLFNELWKFFKEHSDPDDSDEFWKDLRDKGSELNNTFRDMDDADLKNMAEKLIVSTMLSIQDIYRRKAGRI